MRCSPRQNRRQQPESSDRWPLTQNEKAKESLHYLTETYGFDSDFNAIGSFGTGGAGLSSPTGYAAARAKNIGYLCSWQVNDWNGQTALSLTATPPWSGCASQ